MKKKINNKSKSQRIVIQPTETLTEEYVNDILEGSDIFQHIANEFGTVYENIYFYLEDNVDLIPNLEKMNKVLTKTSVISAIEKNKNFKAMINSLTKILANEIVINTKYVIKDIKKGIFENDEKNKSKIEFEKSLTAKQKQLYKKLNKPAY